MKQITPITKFKDLIIHNINFIWYFLSKLLISIILIGVMVYFALNLQTTIIDGQQKEDRITQLENEIKELKNENNNLKHEYDIYTSDVVLESKIRELEGVQKPDEVIYKISDENFITEEKVENVPLDKEDKDDEDLEVKSSDVTINESRANLSNESKPNFMLWLDLLIG